jgi:NAD(P)H-nitrite reductase large subunit
MNFDYLIIGSGIAGISAVETLRKFNKECSIGLISNESHAPYSKGLLPFYLKNKITYDKLFIRGKDFWSGQNIQFIFGEVIKLQRNTRSLIIQNPVTRHETIVSYRDKLLIASGANSKKLDFPGCDLFGIFYFRDLDDAATIRNYFDTWKYQSKNEKERIAGAEHTKHLDTPEYRSEPKPVIYGASFIALEFAGIFAHLGIPAKLIFRGPHFWSRLLDRQGGELIEKCLREAGMEIHRSEELRAVYGSAGKLEKITTQDSEYECNFLGIGVGLEPNLDFARQAGLKVNQGIVTDEFLETSDPNIFAAGDIAEFYDVVIGRHHVLGNWLNSDMQGRTAAINMLGMKKPFELISSYSFNFDGYKGKGKFNICAIGDTATEQSYSTKLYLSDRQYIKLFSKNDCCVGAALINLPQLRSKVTEAIKFKTSPSSIDI